MARPPSRDVFAILLKNFIKSFTWLKPKQIFGTLRGTDYFGNTYYEISGDRSIGKRRQRWFEPPQKENFEQEVPAEWESWLRGRREEIPTEEEIKKSVAIMQIKQKNAIEVEKKSGKPTPMTKGIETFPKRPEFEIVPGKPQK